MSVIGENMGDLNQFDQLDRRIIEMMCTSSQGSYRQLAKQLGVHPTTLIQRVKALETKGVITGYRAKMDYFAMGFTYMGLVQIFSDDIVQAEKDLAEIDEVMAVYDVTGEADAIAIVACEDRERFYTVIKGISSLPTVRKSNTSIILDVVKSMEDFVPCLTDEAGD